MSRGRPKLPLGTWGNIGYSTTAAGTIEARATVRHVNGKSSRVKARGKSKSAARQRLLEKLADVTTVTDGGSLTRTSTVAALMSAWIDSRRGEVRQQSLDRYETSVNLHIVPAFGDMRVNEVTPAFLDTYVRSLSHGTAPGVLRALRGAFSLAVRYGLIAHNPADAVRPVKAPKKEVRALTPGELPDFRAAIVDHGDGLLTDVVDFCLATGLRAGEVLALKFSDVDLDSGTPTISLGFTLVHTREKGNHRQDEGKTDSSRRVIQLPTVAVEIVRRRRAEHGDDIDWVFPSAAGTMMWESNFNRKLRAARGERWGWVTVHTLRRTLASIVADELGPHKAADVLGHADSVLTETVYYQRNRQGVPIGDVVDRVLKGGQKGAEY